MSGSENIGVIAGGGQFPKLFIDAAQKSGKRSVVIAFRGETSDEVIAAADELCWVKLGQVGKVIKFFKKHNVSEAVFLGTITKTRIFRDIFFDLKGLSLWNKIDIKQDDALLRAIAGALQEYGITIIESTRYLSELFFPSGILTKKKPGKKQREDIAFGWPVAKGIGQLDIGQCIVVRNQTVLAVEAIDGTDATILRGGKLGKEKVVIIKVHKPGQDFRFDLPATGLGTIESIKKVNGAVLAVEAGRSLIFDSEAVIREADRSGIIIIGVTEDKDGNISY